MLDVTYLSLKDFELSLTIFRRYKNESYFMYNTSDLIFGRFYYKLLDIRTYIAM